MDFGQFKTNVNSFFGLDLHSYKETQLKRRLDNLMARHNIDNYSDFFFFLKTDQVVYQDFCDTLTINVSEFFRDKVIFKNFEQNILPQLLKNKHILKIWSAACSNGAEPYSVAIILDELTPGHEHKIEATDLDRKILQDAAVGRYPADAVRNVQAQRLAKYFRREGDKYVLLDSIKNKVSFRVHDLLKDNYGQGYDLIICRNVTIYFTREAQNEVNIKLARALNVGGVLFIGSSEMIFNYKALGYEKLGSCFYRKVTVSI
ncbi:CheR family methyltransferase [Desulfolucanica intricata]|uniref:CheR family methyltransferase n=1 Tax=Desulfolucanica intricata TaxID=1285191 RepID=UPI00082D5216|nr:protein-glutamate O-methyltransferase CheR [Desulfolucanica intricata]